MAPGNLLVDGFKKLLEKIETTIEDKMEMDSEDIEITFMKTMSFLWEMKSAIDTTRKAFSIGESDPKLLKHYEEIAGELNKLEGNMKDRLAGVADLIKFFVFQDKIKIPAIKISEALNFYYAHKTPTNKEGFLKTAKHEGPPMSVLMRLRDQLPKILEGSAVESDDSKEMRQKKQKIFLQLAQMVLLVVIQMVTANEEYLIARFSDDIHAKRNDNYRNELMEVVRDIYGCFNFKIEYPKFDSDKIGAIVKEIASSSNDGHHERIHDALKKEFAGEYFLVMTYNDNWKQPEMTSDGNTYTFHQDGNFYLVHRFKVAIPNNNGKLLEYSAKCDDILWKHLYEKKYYWRDVTKKITEQTKSFAIFYSKFGDSIEYRLNYKIDDEVKSALYYKDWKVEGADINNGDQVVRATFIATLI